MPTANKVVYEEKLTNGQVKKLYNGTVTVEFFDEWINPATNRVNKHVYLVNGKRCPDSVTGATGMLDKSAALKKWAVRLNNNYLLGLLNQGVKITDEHLMEAAKQHTIKLEKEATSGSLVHEWAEQYIKGKNPEMPEDERVVNGVTAFLKWVEEYKVKFTGSEQLVYSKKHKYIGTMDCKFTMGSEKHKIVHCGDFKTSSGIYNEMRYQVAAYQAADAEESNEDYGSKWIIRFDKDTADFEAKEFPFSEHKEDFSAFLGLLAVKRREDVLKTY